MLIHEGDRLRTTVFPGIYHEDLYVGDGRCMAANKRFGRVTETPCPLNDPTLSVLPATNSPAIRNLFVARMRRLQDHQYDLWSFNCQGAANYSWYGTAFSPQRDAVVGLAVLAVGL